LRAAEAERIRAAEVSTLFPLTFPL
jgi:hypothetical protein